jgi:hypothetical protein
MLRWRRKAMKKWTYKVTKIRPTWESTGSKPVSTVDEIIEAYLNGIGEQGWELVSLSHPSISAHEEPGTLYAIFKMPSA